MRLFENIINYYKKIFYKQKQLNSIEMKQEPFTKNENTFMNSLQKNNREYINKKSILDEINKNPDLINILSYSRLVQLNSLYEEKIIEVERKIKQLS